MRRSLLLAATVAALGAAGAALAHVRLIHPTNLNPLYWQNPGSVGIVIQAAGSADVPDASDTTALRNAIDAWNSIPGTTAQLVENASAAQQARTDWEANDIHLILFDETNSSGYFPLGSGTVALTPVYFQSNGRIVDADVLFNGFGFLFTTDGDPGRFDVQDVAAHELGHLLGLDHTGWAGGTLYPYVDPLMVLHRSLALDDEHGLRDAYPSLAHASVTGAVRRSSDGSLVRGAHVVARDAAGRTAGADLTNAAGVFAIRGLDGGTYTLAATPLDHPVSAANLDAGTVVDVDFASTVGGAIAVGAGATVGYGDLLVGADAVISLGRSADTLPLRATIGTTTAHALSGAGLVAGSSLACSDPAMTLSAVVWTGTGVSFQVSVPAGTAPGHADLTATSASGEASILVAPLELVPPDPVVSTVAPPTGSLNGGTAVAIAGSGFRAGARVVIGSRIYADGVPLGCTVVDASTITLTTQATGAGICDVVVIDSTGVEGREVAGFQFLSAPSIATVFPSAGSDLGGTQVAISGSGFLAGLAVRINGVVQPQVTVESSTRARVTTEAGIAGGPYVLEVENTDGAAASSAFSYAGQADPQVSGVLPASGSKSGGKTVTVDGAGFSASAQVWFGVDPDTGLGGIQASSATVLGPTSLEAVTPAHAQGAVAVMVLDGATGQAAVLDDGYTFADTGGGGGGGGCHTQPSADPWDPRAIVSGLSALALAVFVWTLLQLRLRRRLARAWLTARDPGR